jgi:hypothetical protein
MLVSLDVLPAGKALQDWRHRGVAQFVVRRTPFPDAVMTRTSRDDAGLLVLEDARSVYWFLLPHRSVDELRAGLASWVARATGSVGNVDSNPVGSPEAAAYRALSVVRAAALGREPVADRNTLAYRLSVGNDYLLRGNVLEAIVLTEGLAKCSTEAYGATDEDTIAVRDNLAYAKAVAGERLEAIRLYWAILDDLAEAGMWRNPAGNRVRQNLAKLHNPGWLP